MKELLKSLINNISPNIGKGIRNLKLKRLITSTPQISSEGLRFWGGQNYENHEPSISKLLIDLMKKSDVFINVGANHGIYCLKLSSLATIVYAFEALPDNLSLLMKNIRENSLTNKIVVFPVAAGAGQSLATFYGASTGGSLLKGWNQQVDDGINVSVLSLDFLLQSSLKNTRPLFLIDVEGSEYEVIKGAKGIIENIEKATFCIEISCRQFMPGQTFNPNFINIFEYFYSVGFMAYEILDTGALIKLTKNLVWEYLEKSRFEAVMAVFTRDSL
ncbi:MAG: FkbM family methyltransferase [Cylindrospermopsis raciborskii KL1]|jgi:FkbM family methyltransferase|uniref:FkbM family methyltransferase n=1 Tax=Cylindrospermopsis raciborskii TaxID=77022 RepID=UPI001A25D6D8|nr:FkbM family methyltransferase [Cylindrospermopsis raciborskii]MBG0744347.1 FkbM family methyltransferase [Cylindrospermopsis raciborskii KL1]